MFEGICARHRQLGLISSATWLHGWVGPMDLFLWLNLFLTISLSLWSLFPQISTYTKTSTISLPHDLSSLPLLFPYYDALHSLFSHDLSFFSHLYPTISFSPLSSFSNNLSTPCSLPLRPPFCAISLPYCATLLLCYSSSCDSPSPPNLFPCERCIY